MDKSGAEVELKGKAGIPAQYYVALFSAAEELLEEEIGGLREQIRENRILDELEDGDFYDGFDRRPDEDAERGEFTPRTAPGKSRRRPGGHRVRKRL